MEGKVYAQVYSLIRAEHDGLIDALHEFSRVGYDGVEIVSANSEREYYHFEGSDGTASCCVKFDYDYLRNL